MTRAILCNLQIQLASHATPEWKYHINQDCSAIDVSSLA
jgi:hypothetical protein